MLINILMIITQHKGVHYKIKINSGTETTMFLVDPDSHHVSFRLQLLPSHARGWPPYGHLRAMTCRYAMRNIPSRVAGRPCPSSSFCLLLSEKSKGPCQIDLREKERHRNRSVSVPRKKVLSCVETLTKRTTEKNESRIIILPPIRRKRI